MLVVTMKNTFQGRHGRTTTTMLLLWFFLALSACIQDDDGEAIRALIQQGALLAEAHDMGGLLDLASEDFRAVPGDLDRNGVKGILWRAFQYYGNFNVLYPRPGVTVSEDGRNGSARCPFLIVKGDAALPKLRELYDDPQAWVKEAGEKADLYLMTLTLRKKGGDWLVQKAQLERFTGLGFDS
jgi:hypothetical protein